MEKNESKIETLKTTWIALDTYDDIFSDFDPAPYSQRLLSIDFLKELSRHYAETKKGECVVNFTILRKLRNPKTETLVKKRIKDHFRDRLKKADKSIRSSQLKGGAKVIIGTIISLFLFTIPLVQDMSIITVLSVLMWYALWTGYTDVFESAGKLNGKKDFYYKFLNAKYNFIDEESLIAMVGGTDQQSAQKSLEKRGVAGGAT